MFILQCWSHFSIQNSEPGDHHSLPRNHGWGYPLSNLWVWIHHKYLQALPLTVVERLPRMGQVRDVPTPPVLITSPLPAQYDPTSTDPSILCLHHPPGRQPGRWRRQGGRRRGSRRQQCSHLGCVYVCSLCERVCACILHCITSSSLHVSRKVFIFAD